MSLRAARPIIAVMLTCTLGACASAVDRISAIGQQPPLTGIAVAPNSAAGHPVSMPMPDPQTTPHKANSLWQAGSRSFFRDPRAARVGDLLTVNIDIGDQAKIANTTTRSRKNSEDANASNFLGIESELTKILPSAVNPDKLIGFGSDTSNSGTGSVDRSETIKLTVAAVVTQVMPNGNLVIQGSQEVLVNYEKRVLTVSGIVRPEDISNANTISHTQIAEARISYGGQGQITDVQQPRYGQQLFDVLFPF